MNTSRINNIKLMTTSNNSNLHPEKEEPVDYVAVLEKLIFLDNHQA